MSHHERPEHPNVAVLRAMNEAFQRNDMEAMASFIADDVVWHEIGSSEPVRGREALAARWAGMPTDLPFSVDVHDVVAGDDHGVALVTATVGEGDKAFTYRTAEIYHLRDGKVTERWAFSDDTDAINKFFAGF